MNLQLMLFAKAPVAGAVKTRLSPPLTAEQAALLHAALAERALAAAIEADLGTVEVWCAGMDEHPFWHTLAAAGAVRLRRQVGDDLGARMRYAIADALGRGRNGMIIGADCPALDTGYLRAAARSLDHGTDIVLGPATDGGYVLIGARQSDPALFEGIDWGSPQVLAQTVAVIDRLGWSCKLLAPLADIDRPEDLTLLPEALRRVYAAN